MFKKETEGGGRERKRERYIFEALKDLQSDSHRKKKLYIYIYIYIYMCVCVCVCVCVWNGQDITTFVKQERGVVGTQGCYTKDNFKFWRVAKATYLTILTFSLLTHREMEDKSEIWHFKYTYIREKKTDVNQLTEGIIWNNKF